MLLLAVLVGCAHPEPVDSADTSGPSPLRFAFPVEERDRIGQVVGFDHDPTVYDTTLGHAICSNYDGLGFPACYDEHHGTDFMLIGGFDQMDAGSATVRAAADGVVEDVVDGNYDRCHATPSGVDCDGHPMIANRIVVRHDTGVSTLYYHLMSGSPLVQVGDTVTCGQPLALIGSSGNSSAPHLHFQVEDPDGVPFDPYAGSVSGPVSWWTDQGEPDELPGSACAP